MFILFPFRTRSSWCRFDANPTRRCQARSGPDYEGRVYNTSPHTPTRTSSSWRLDDRFDDVCGPLANDPVRAGSGQDDVLAEVGQVDAVPDAHRQTVHLFGAHVPEPGIERAGVRFG